MNTTRLLLSALLVALPALALPFVRTTRRPRAWSYVLVTSLGAGFVLVVVSLIHESLPLVFTLMGLDHLAAACRSLGGHLFGGTPPLNALAALLAVSVCWESARGVRATVKVNMALRRGSRAAASGTIGGQNTVIVPMSFSWAVAVPGSIPVVAVSPAMVDTLETQEIDAVVRHELAHLEHHHAGFLLLGVAATAGLWFMPGRKAAATAFKLALERWADESSAGRAEERGHVRSALRKLTAIAPSAMARYRISALESPAGSDRHEWGWPTVAMALVPLVVALTVTLVAHLVQVVQIAGGS